MQTDCIEGIKMREGWTGVNERTFIAVKPDGVQRKLVGEIMRRFEKRGFKLVALKLVKVFTSDVVETARKMLGETNPADSLPGTIRGDFCVEVGKNDLIISYREENQSSNPRSLSPVFRKVIHGSDSVESAQKEICLWFRQSELHRWESSSTNWIY
ncbi:hypothetical protein GOODEAATRI_013917 [Goodea atripinnis]|uniref:Nucleoside diphosphate kinase B n=1 Tax=Goodea atripinnis TaxID=208336 RepID=A0ABV0P404_9TELE